MKLWLISQDVNNDYDTYDSAVVAAETEDDARNTHPRGKGRSPPWLDNFGEWAEYPYQVTVTYLGIADASVKPGVVCASFNAG